jgi:TolB-like protein
MGFVTRLSLGLWIGAVGVAIATADAHAATAPTVAVFPFELMDSSQEGELFVKVRPEETKRLAALVDDLKARLTTSGQFEVVGVEPLAAELKAAAPLYSCNGCELNLAKKSGAKLVMLGLVQKFSDTLLAINVQVVDAETGMLKGSYSAGVQGNTDEAWLRGLGYIVRNKIITQEPQK